jgi:hypothetical protein
MNTISPNYPNGLAAGLALGLFAACVVNVLALWSLV